MKAKKEIQNRISDKVFQMTGTRYYIHDIGIVMDAFLYVIEEALINDEEVYLHGFGVFKPHHYPDKKARNPVTGETIIVPAHTGVKFAPGPTFRQAMVDGMLRFERSVDNGNEIDGDEG